MTSVIENPNECSFPGCPALGTHRVTIVLTDGGRDPLSQKYILADPNGRGLMRRCNAHQPDDPWAYITSNDIWYRFAANFARCSNTANGFVRTADRALTHVFYTDDQKHIENIPVLVPTPRGLEEVGKTRLIS